MIDPFRKYYPVDKLEEACARWREEGHRVVFTNGVFDLIHPGHVQYLAEAKALGEVLIVALNSDRSARSLAKGPGRPINDDQHRLSVVAALQSVDAVTLFDEPTPEELIVRLRPDVLVKGGDYRVNEIAGGEAVRNSGGMVRVLKFAEGYSTTMIEQKIRNRVD